MSRPQAARGFTLIEILIALLVLSAGVLASLGLQVVASSNTQNASQRLQAVDLADDLLGRIRANFGEDAVEKYLELTSGSELGGGTLSTPATDCGVYETQCTPVQQATYDLWQWERRLDGHYKTTDGSATGGLIDPSACLYGPAGGGSGFYQIVIVWRSATESENLNSGDANIDGCGNSTNEYGTGNVHRRVMSMTTYIASL